MENNEVGFVDPMMRGNFTRYTSGVYNSPKTVYHQGRGVFVVTDNATNISETVMFWMLNPHFIKSHFLPTTMRPSPRLNNQ